MGSTAVSSEGTVEKTFGNQNIIKKDRIWHRTVTSCARHCGGRNAWAQVPIQSLSFQNAVRACLLPETFNLDQIPVNRRVWESAWYHYYTALDDENQLMFTLLSPRGKMQPWTLSIWALCLEGSSSCEIFHKTQLHQSCCLAMPSRMGGLREIGCTFTVVSIPCAILKLC